MPLVDCIKDGSLFAEHYSHLNMKGTRFLAFRDIPMLIKKYTSGTGTLDYGCGTGSSSIFLKTLGLNVDGVDINGEMIKHAKEKDSTGTYKHIKDAEIPARDNNYDIVFSSFVLMEVSCKQELAKSLREITRVLKTGGTFIAIVSNSDAYNNDWLSVSSKFKENESLQSGSRVKVHFKDIDLTIWNYFWSAEDYREVMNEAGLEIVHMHYPLGKDEDGYAWVSEKVKAHSVVYVAKKLEGGKSYGSSISS